jgi:hypothetical protein
MKDYSEMSDFDISKMVFLKTGNEYDDYDKNPFPDDCPSFCYGDGTNWHEFDINNPSDMWPLIVENGICIHVDNIGENSYANTFDSHGYCEKEFYDKNPLRAAAIVYLMIKDAADSTRFPTRSFLAVNIPRQSRGPS